jgi:hypothetical protein
MRKLLHLAFAVWQTGKPFDPEHYPWDRPAHVEQEAEVGGQKSGGGKQELGRKAEATGSELPSSPTEKAAGLRKPAEPGRKEVTAASAPIIPHAGGLRAADTASKETPVAEAAYLDFAHLKKQLPLARVLDQLGLSSRLRGKAPQMRCACPIHRGDQRGRTFSMHLEQGVFQCFDVKCAAKGDVIDLWASVKGMSLRDAVLDLARTFALEPAPTASAPPTRTEKRQG